VLNFPPASAVQIDVAGIPAELHSAFSNLLSNAMRYTPAGGQIDVTGLPADGVPVRRAGLRPGIDPEHVSRLTERFYRVDRSRSRDTGGTGLGLAIVKHVLQRHGRNCTSAAAGQGLEFSVTFPAQRLRAHAIGHRQLKSFSVATRQAGAAHPGWMAGSGVLRACGKSRRWRCNMATKIRAVTASASTLEAQNGVGEPCQPVAIPTGRPGVAAAQAHAPQHGA
jgi:hypothetical protein